MKVIGIVTMNIDVAASTTNDAVVSDHAKACLRTDAPNPAKPSIDTRDFGKVRLGANRPAL